MMSQIIESNHIPYHILSKSHIVEKLDKSNVDVLSKLEKSVNLRGKLESINPALKPFFRAKIAIVDSGISALMKLVAYVKSANSSSLENELDYIVERKGKVKHVSLSPEKVCKTRLICSFNS